MEMNFERIERIKEMLKESPQDSFLRFALAQEYTKTNKLEDAKNLYQQIVTDDPDYVGTYYHLGKLLEDNDTEKAKQIYQAGIEIAQKKGASNDLRELLQALNNISF